VNLLNSNYLSLLRIQDHAHYEYHYEQTQYYLSGDSHDCLILLNILSKLFMVFG